MNAAEMYVDVKVRLDNLESGLSRMDSRLAASAKKGARHANTMDGAFAKVGRRLAMLGGGLAVGGGLAALGRNAMNLEKQMSQLAAVTGATGAQMKALETIASKATRGTAYSAVDAAQAMTELAKGGIAVSQIGPALKGTMTMAAAGGIGVAEAATAAANAMNLFGINGKGVTHVADAFAKAANDTTADVGDFAMALSQGGGVAKQAGLSFTETMLALEALAKSGVKNSDAGTSLKTTLVQLLTPSKKQATMMKELGLSFVDNTGKMKGMVAISAMLRDKLGGMTQAQRIATMAQLAGTDGVRTLAALYDAGAGRLTKWREGLTKSGTAAEVAKKMNDNAATSVKSLMNSAMTAGSGMLSGFLPMLKSGADQLRLFVEHAQDSGALERFGSRARSAAQDGISRVTDAIHTVAPAMSMLKGVIDSVGFAPIIGGMLAFKAAMPIGGSIANMATAFSAAGKAGAGFGGSLMAMVNPVMLAAAGVGLLAAGMLYLSSQQSSAAHSANEAKKAILGLADANNTARDAARGYTDAKQRVKQSSLGVEQAEKAYAQAVQSGGKKSLEARQAHLQLQMAQIEQQRATVDLTSAGMKMRSSQEGQATASAKVTKSIDDVTAAAQRQGRAIEQTSRGGGKFAGAVPPDVARQQAEALNQAASSYRNLAKSSKETNGPLSKAAALIADVIDVTHKIPNTKTTRLFLTGAAEGINNLDTIVGLLASIKDKSVRVTVTQAVESINPGGAHGGRPPGYKPPKKGTARGGVNDRGMVTGSFAGRDSVDAIVKPGERVVNASQWAAIQSGADPDLAMRGAVQLAKGGTPRQARPLEKFLGVNLTDRISKAHATLSDADDRIAAKAAVKQIKSVLGHKKYRGLTLMHEEKRTLWEALGQFRQTALKPPAQDRSADEFLSDAAKMRLAEAHATIDGADDKVAAGKAVTELEAALKRKGVTANERMGILESLGQFRREAAADNAGPDVPTTSQFEKDKAHEAGVLEGLGRLVDSVFMGATDIGTGKGNVMQVHELRLVASSANTSAIADANNRGSDTLYRSRSTGSRTGVG